jgi:hypothetical protein
MAIAMKKNVMIRIDANLVQKAKELGLNISKVSENALKEMIRRIERPITPKEARDCPDKPQNKNGIASVSMAGGVGFEPTTTSLGGLRPVHARLPALLFSLKKALTLRFWSTRFWSIQFSSLVPVIYGHTVDSAYDIQTMVFHS